MANIVIKSTYLSVIFLLCSFCTISSLRHHIAPCAVTKPCVCEFPTGEGIDLTVMSENTLSFNMSRSFNMTGNVTVFFQPCHTIREANISTCNESSLCLFNHTSNQSIPLGNVDELKFKSENLVQPVQLQFVHGQITSTIDLRCPESQGTSFFGNKTNDNQYHFYLESPAVCTRVLEGHHGRSLISVLLISFLIVGITYIVAMIFVRRSRGAVGWELLPHHEMCLRIPTLCRAGCNSFLSCCRLQPSYEQI